ncbi:hypothetical protein [uncultured Rhodospira sp.]|mgnify:CR=1 FL=1|uniref:hypothetical protein n=1 Tax=uncultured Rhodospira sp. TaxID=1936189 RepID=UPI002626BE6C|nr:hypothetical protein [uncultured Rhodospira sp.]
MRAFQEQHPSVSHAIKYEALTENPESILAELCTFLDEPFDHQMLEHHQGSHNFGNEDPQVRGISGFRPSRDNWKAMPGDAVDLLRRELGETAVALGYSIH